MAAVALCPSLLAQQTLGGITGEVTDPTGGAIPNVQVTAVGEQTALSRSVKTNGTGVYAFVNLPIGTYTLTFTAEGFEAQKTPHITVQADRTATVNAQLKIGKASETIEVQATPLLNAVDTTNGYVMDKQQIEMAPLATGSFTGLAIQSTGVSAELNGGTGVNAGLGNAPIWANGQRDTSNTFLLNGVDASNFQRQDHQPGGQLSRGQQHGQRQLDRRGHDPEQRVDLSVGGQLDPQPCPGDHRRGARERQHV